MWTGRWRFLALDVIAVSVLVRALPASFLCDQMCGSVQLLHTAAQRAAHATSCWIRLKIERDVLRKRYNRNQHQR